MVWDDALSLSFAASQGHQHAMPPSSLRHRHSAVITPPSLLRHRVAATSCRAVARMICDEPSQGSRNSATRRRNAVANPRHLVTLASAASRGHASGQAAVALAASQGNACTGGPLGRGCGRPIGRHKFATGRRKIATDRHTFATCRCTFPTYR